MTFHKGTVTTQKKPLSTMLATSKKVLFPGHNHLLTTGADDPSLWLSPEHQWVTWWLFCAVSIAVLGHTSRIYSWTSHVKRRLSWSCYGDRMVTFYQKSTRSFFIFSYLKWLELERNRVSLRYCDFPHTFFIGFVEVRIVGAAEATLFFDDLSSTHSWNIQIILILVFHS